MKLSKAQLVYIQSERKRMDDRLKDLDSFGEDIYKSPKLSSDRTRIYYNQWFFNHILKLHNVEVQAEKALEGSMSKEDYEAIYGWGGQG